MSTAPELTPLTFDEVLSVEAYRESVKNAVASANSSCDKMITAAFSLATAYGALLALVAPEGDPADVLLALPIAGFAIAAVVALAGYVKAVDVTSEQRITVENVAGRVQSALNWKQGLAVASVLTLAVSILLATFVILSEYGAEEEAGTVETTVFLSQAGRESIERACGQDLGEVSVSLPKDALGKETITLDLGDQCPDVAGEITLPREAVAAAASSE